jgi:hypothetical protein
VEPQMSFCQRMAAKCEERAVASDEPELRQFLFRLRDTWLNVASGLQDYMALHKSVAARSPCHRVPLANGSGHWSYKERFAPSASNKRSHGHRTDSNSLSERH